MSRALVGEPPLIINGGGGLEVIFEDKSSQHKVVGGGVDRGNVDHLDRIASGEEDPRRPFELSIGGVSSHTRAEVLDVCSICDNSGTNSYPKIVGAVSDTNFGCPCPISGGGGKLVAEVDEFPHAVGGDSERLVGVVESYVVDLLDLGGESCADR